MKLRRFVKSRFARDLDSKKLHSVKPGDSIVLLESPVLYATNTIPYREFIQLSVMEDEECVFSVQTQVEMTLAEPFQLSPLFDYFDTGDFAEASAEFARRVRERSEDD
jgi:hypothetical protein